MFIYTKIEFSKNSKILVMKKTIFISIFTIVYLGIFFAPASAQLDKKEAKALKKEIKALKGNLEAFKRMKDDDRALDNQINQKHQEIQSKKAQDNTSKADLSKKDDAITYLQERINKLSSGEVNATRQGRGAHDCAFSVQIGAYNNTDLTQYMDNHPNFGVEIDDTGLKKYTLGYFSSYWEAKSFSKYLDSRGAISYVVGFYKGERVPDLKDMTQCTF